MYNTPMKASLASALVMAPAQKNSYCTIKAYLLAQGTSQPYAIQTSRYAMRASIVRANLLHNVKADKA